MKLNILMIQEVRKVTNLIIEFIDIVKSLEITESNKLSKCMKRLNSLTKYVWVLSVEIVLSLTFYNNNNML